MTPQAFQALDAACEASKEYDEFGDPISEGDPTFCNWNLACYGFFDLQARDAYEERLLSQNKALKLLIQSKNSEMESIDSFLREAVKPKN